jgi:hypothetical protein
MTLTETDRKTIVRAREVAVQRSVSDSETVEFLSSAQYLLLELAAIADRLQGDVSRLRTDRAIYRTQLGLPPDDDDREALREAGS